MYFSIWDSNTYFFNITFLLKWFYVFYWKRNTKLNLKFMEIFPCIETMPRAHGMKSDEKPFFCQIYVIFFWGGG